MSTYVYIYIYIYIYIYTDSDQSCTAGRISRQKRYTHTHVHIFTRVCLYILISLCKFIHIYVHSCTHIHRPVMHSGPREPPKVVQLLRRAFPQRSSLVSFDLPSHQQYAETMDVSNHEDKVMSIYAYTYRVAKTYRFP